MKKCIICGGRHNEDKDANATGSHIIPASLLQKCIGKHYSEESYEIDSSNVDVDVYYGRDNLKNVNPEVKKHHYKEDNILCQLCEDKLGKLEGDFSTEFLQKFRLEKFKHNFNYYHLDLGLEICEPKRLTNLQIHAYIYSIILRFCRNEEMKHEQSIILNESELIKIQSFVYGFLYKKENNYSDSISDFNLILTFDKYSQTDSLIATLEEIKDPYIFYFCEVIVQLFTNGVNENNDNSFRKCITNIQDLKTKIIVGPSKIYQDLQSKANIAINEFVANALDKITKQNNKNYEENYKEFILLALKFESEGVEDLIFKAIEALQKKYKS